MGGRGTEKFVESEAGHHADTHPPKGKECLSPARQFGNFGGLRSESVLK